MRGLSPSVRQRADGVENIERFTAGDSVGNSDLGAWLQRLIGRYKIDGTVEQTVDLDQSGAKWVSRKASGAADCQRIGDGAGTHCVINVEWPQILVRGTPTAPAFSEFFTLRPAILLFGIDSKASGIHVLQVDERSIAVSALGLLSGDTLRLETTCTLHFYDPWCKRMVRITAKPSSDLIKMEIAIYGGTRFSFNLRREPSLK